MLGRCAPFALGLSLALAPACQEPVPAQPADLIVVETDLPVPRAVERLRIDASGAEV
jgi:hypothetical protein